MKQFAISAIALTLCSGAALAQSSVTVYGVADAGLVLERGGAAGNVNTLGGGVGSGSRLGFKGKEDLGGGLSARFILESGIGLDNGASGQGGLTFGRQAALGLSGSFGAVSLGRQYSPYYKVVRDVADPFEVGFAGTASNLMATNTRVDNLAEYTSPTVAGFTADLAYGAGETAGNSAANRSLSGSASYVRGPLTVVLAHHVKDNALATAHARNTMIVARYCVDAWSASLARAVNRDLFGAESKDTLLGLSATAGANKVLASVILHQDDSALDHDARQYAIGYLRRLSVRTELYAAYAHINNRNGASFKVGNATDNGSGHTGVNLGMRHSF